MFADNENDFDFATLGLEEVALDTYENIPDGEYPVVIESAEAKPHADGHGKRLSFKVRIVSGEYRGRTLYDGLSVVHRNEMAQQIALKKLKTLIEVSGGKAQKPSDLVGVEVVAKIGMSKGSNGYEPKNEVKAYRKPGASSAPSWLGGK
jgi:stress-induced morphogen